MNQRSKKLIDAFHCEIAHLAAHYQEVVSFFSELYQVEAWGSLYLLKIFQEKNIFNIPEKHYSILEIQTLLNLAPLYTRLLDSLLELLIKHSQIELVSFNTYQLKNTDSISLLSLQETKAALIKNFPKLQQNIQLLDEAFKIYTHAICGEANFLTILFPQGSFEVIEDIYKNNTDAAYYNKLTSVFIIDIIKNYFEEPKNVSVIEIGAGIGSTSANLLPLLKQNTLCSSYLYTDISRLFLQFGKKNYGSAYEFLSFAPLNIAKAPNEQGFLQNYYDIAIATNVLHATDDILATLQNTRSLLKTGGILVINEGIIKRDYSTLAYGLLPGWWAFKDNEWRITGSPFLSAKSWQKALSLTGFEVITTLTLQSKVEHYQDIIVAEAK